MTRFLSQALQAEEPFFRQGLQRLELANGNPSSDIRLSAEVNHVTKQKLLELGLDPHDTTARELFNALQQKVRQDDARLSKVLRTKAATHVSAEADIVDGMVHALKELPDSRRCFTLKASSLKTLLQNVPPKKAMKQLGYRSLASFLKHEAPVLILAAAWLTEGEGWQKRFLDQYKKLQPRDFESRNIAILQPDSKRWQNLAAKTVEENRHNILSFKELGALIFLPLPKDVPAGAVTASLSLALHELNEIRASSTFLKLCQVKSDFGQMVKTVASDEAHLSSKMLDQPVPWHLIQRYYSRLSDRFREEVFEPYLQLEDMVWHPVEKALASIEPSFNFWHQTDYLGLLDGHKPVSLNLLDSALSFCNRLPYEQRAVHFFQRSLWHELLLRYLKHQPVEDTVLTELQPQLAEERVLA
jgi:hypothetical protein